MVIRKFVRTPVVWGSLSLIALGAIAINGLSSLSTPSVANSIPAPVLDSPKDPTKTTETETAIFAGGCFWSMEAIFEALKGVTDVVSGFSGGSAENAQYEVVSSGKTDHAEGIKVTYDPSQISYGQLLQIYFFAHDPTQLNRQGPNWGTQYRSAIFFVNDEQKRIAQAYIEQLNKAQIFDQPIVTQLSPLNDFYVASDYHQNFIARNPNYPYVVIHDRPKLKKVHAQFPSLYKN